jgi:hypothetical protein
MVRESGGQGVPCHFFESGGYPPLDLAGMSLKRVLDYARAGARGGSWGGGTDGKLASPARRGGRADSLAAPDARRRDAENVTLEEVRRLMATSAQLVEVLPQLGDGRGHGRPIIESPLEVVGRDAERAQRVPHSERHARDTEGRHDAMEGAVHER